jgi:hypothetical protein
VPIRPTPKQAAALASVWRRWQAGSPITPKLRALASTAIEAAPPRYAEAVAAINAGLGLRDMDIVAALVTEAQDTVDGAIAASRVVLGLAVLILAAQTCRLGPRFFGCVVTRLCAA